MHRRNTLFLSLAALSLSAIPSAFALEGGSFDAPNGANDPGWANVGTVGVGSCVFLGSSATGYWVLSVAHAGVTDFSSVTFGTGTYSVIEGSRFSFTNPDSSVADLTLFRISGDSSLAALNSISISSTAPESGSTVTQIGYGGGSQSWGNTTVTVANSFGSIDSDVHKSYTFQSRDMTVKAVSGDSGGGVFQKDGEQWYLTGLMQATGDSGGYHHTQSIQLANYAAQINAYMTAVPEPSTYALMAGGAGLLAIGVRRRRAR